MEGADIPWREIQVGEGRLVQGLEVRTAGYPADTGGFAPEPVHQAKQYLRTRLATTNNGQVLAGKVMGLVHQVNAVQAPVFVHRFACWRHMRTNAGTYAQVTAEHRWSLLTERQPEKTILEIDRLHSLVEVQVG